MEKETDLLFIDLFNKGRVYYLIQKTFCGYFFAPQLSIWHEKELLRCVLLKSGKASLRPAVGVWILPSFEGLMNAAVVRDIFALGILSIDLKRDELSLSIHPILPPVSHLIHSANLNAGIGSLEFGNLVRPAELGMWRSQSPNFCGLGLPLPDSTPGPVFSQIKALFKASFFDFWYFHKKERDLKRD